MEYKLVHDLIYLGVKIVLRRYVSEDFQPLIQRALGKLNSWGSKSLSLAGRSILINSSLLSIPTFLMTHLLVPKGILNDLDILCRKFFWHKDHSRQALHYVNDLCIPKSFGGLGFHYSSSWQGPLKTRLAWNFIQNPNSLLNKIVRAKYGNNLLNSSAKRHSSPTLKILLDGAQHFKTILRWEIADGKLINLKQIAGFLIENCATGLLK